MEEEAKLNAVGFDWRSARKLEWEDRYRQLVKFKMGESINCRLQSILTFQLTLIPSPSMPAYGNATVPHDYNQDPALATWCATQRKRWRQKLAYEEKQNGDQLQEFTVDADGKKRKLSSPMTDEEEGKLLALGFEF